MSRTVELSERDLRVVMALASTGVLMALLVWTALVAMSVFFAAVLALGRKGLAQA